MRITFGSMVPRSATVKGAETLPNSTLANFYAEAMERLTF